MGACITSLSLQITIIVLTIPSAPPDFRLGRRAKLSHIVYSNLLLGCSDIGSSKGMVATAGIDVHTGIPSCFRLPLSCCCQCHYYSVAMGNQGTATSARLCVSILAEVRHLLLHNTCHQFHTHLCFFCQDKYTPIHFCVELSS